MANDSRNELGDFLRSRRERLDPKALGLPAARRRTPGLRREEVASRAGIGIDWYIRLEQGRCVRPSTTTIDALARALRLEKVEHDHLRTLARVADGAVFERETVPDALARLVAKLGQPAYVTGRRWDVLAWNRAADSIFAFSRLPDADRNTLIYLLTYPAARRMFGAGWAKEARRVVAQFRATHDLFAGDPQFAALLARLRAGCVEFDAWWKGHDVSKGGAGVKVVKHPTRGTLRLEHTSFQSNDSPSLRLVVYSPA